MNNVLMRFFLLGMLFSLGCAGATSGPGASDTPAQNVSPQSNGFFADDEPLTGPIPPLEDRITLAQNSVLICTDQSQCHPEVVLVSVVTDQGITSCTGVLISKTEVATNDHCFLHSLASPIIYVHLLGTARVGQSLKYRSHVQGTDRVDVAIIRLDQPVEDFVPVPLAANGFEHHEQARMVKVQMTLQNDGTIVGLQQQQNCVATFPTLLYPQVTNSNSALMTFGQCPVEKGNSGSPIFNSKGQLTGLLQGYFQQPNDPTFASQLQSLAFESTELTVAVGTQVACVEEFGQGNSSHCQTPEREFLYMPFDFKTRLSMQTGQLFDFRYGFNRFLELELRPSI